MTPMVMMNLSFGGKTKREAVLQHTQGQITISIHGATDGGGKKIAGVPITVQGWSQSAYPKS